MELEISVLFALGAKGNVGKCKGNWCDIALQFWFVSLTVFRI